jgi:hypothetical protein
VRRPARDQAGRCHQAAQQSLKSVPDQGLAHLCLAEIAIAPEKTPPEIVSELTAATKGDPLSLTSWTLLAEQHEQAGDTAAVVADFKQMLLVARATRSFVRGSQVLLQAASRTSHAKCRRRAQDRPEQLGTVRPEEQRLPLPERLQVRHRRTGAGLRCRLDASRLELLQEDRGRGRPAAGYGALLEWSQRGLKKYPTNVELLGYAEQAYLLRARLTRCGHRQAPARGRSDPA